MKTCNQSGCVRQAGPCGQCAGHCPGRLDECPMASTEPCVCGTDFTCMADEHEGAK